MSDRDPRLQALRERRLQATGKKGNRMATKYKIFANTDDGGPRWQEVDEQEAVSAKAAIRAHLNGQDNEGTYVAVPVRSWSPVTVKVEQALKFS